MIKKMVWEGWVDPFDCFKNPTFQQDEQGEYEDGPSVSLPPPTPVMSTPHGLLPLAEYSGASDRFEFHILHTNFNVCDEILDVVGKVRGVDSVSFESRYRMKIGFPRITGGEPPIFKSTETKQQIQSALLSYFHQDQDDILSVFNDKTKEMAIKARDELDTTYDYWLLHVLPNGQIDITTSTNLTPEFEEKAGELIEVNELVGGVLLASTE